MTRTGGSTLTVSGNTSSKATNVTVNGQTASRYADLLFAKDGFTLAGGTNTFTAIAESPASVFDTNTIAVNLPATNTFKFDANGNMTFDGQKAFEYDDENQLVRVTETNVFKSEFTYDGLGRMRVKKEYTWSGSWALTSETRYIYDGMLVIQERGANSAPRVSYTRGKDLSGGMQGAGGIGGLLARTDHTTASVLLKTAFYHADGNGNVTALLSTNGLVLAWYQYSPFGTMLAQSGPLADVNSFRFSSKMWHDRSGLYYYGYRFYSPNLQRWLNADPIGEAGGINLYGFVGNEPINWIDLFGYDSIVCVNVSDKGRERKVAGGEDMLESARAGQAKGMYDYIIGFHNPQDLEKKLSAVEKSGIKITELVIVDHGGPGVQEVGDDDAIRSGDYYNKKLMDPIMDTLGKHVQPGGKIKLLGCKVAQGKEGDDLMKKVADKTGKTVEAYTGTGYMPAGKPPWHRGKLKTVSPNDDKKKP